MANGYAELRGQLLTERDRLTLRITKIDAVLGGIDELAGGHQAGNGKKKKPTGKRAKVERRKVARVTLPEGDKEAQAKALFLTGEKCPAIAKKLKCSVGSVYAWSSKGKWRAEKAKQPVTTRPLRPVAAGKVKKDNDGEPPWME